MIMVDLSFMDAFGVIVKAPTGVKYTSESGGILCHHPEVEGFFVPLSVGYRKNIEDELHDLLCGGHSDNPYLDKDDLELAMSWHEIRLRLDISALPETEEAWIHVVVENEASRLGPHCDLDGKPGVFVYKNGCYCTIRD